MSEGFVGVYVGRCKKDEWWDEEKESYFEAEDCLTRVIAGRFLTFVDGDEKHLHCISLDKIFSMEWHGDVSCVIQMSNGDRYHIDISTSKFFEAIESGRRVAVRPLHNEFCVTGEIDNFPQC